MGRAQILEFNEIRNEATGTRSVPRVDESRYGHKHLNNKASGNGSGPKIPL
jgi:hypothetical protein